MGAVYTFQDYVTRVTSLIGDGANKLTTTEDGDVDELIKQAVSLFSEHKPHYIKKRILSTGAETYNIDTELGDLWTHGVSNIKSIEYPVDNVPPDYMIEGEDWYVHDDGSEVDGSSLELCFMYKPASGDEFTLEFRLQLELTREGGQNFFHNSFDFTCICFKASELCFLLLASKFAQTYDATISADSVNYSNLTRKYQDLAEEMRLQYNKMVFGSEDAVSAVKPAIMDVDLDLPAKSDEAGRFLFHDD